MVLHNYSWLEKKLRGGLGCVQLESRLSWHQAGLRRGVPRDPGAQRSRGQPGARWALPQRQSGKGTRVVTSAGRGSCEGSLPRARRPRAGGTVRVGELRSTAVPCALAWYQLLWAMPFLFRVIKLLLCKQARLYVSYHSWFYIYRGTNFMYILKN